MIKTAFAVNIVFSQNSAVVYFDLERWLQTGWRCVVNEATSNKCRNLIVETILNVRVSLLTSFYFKKSPETVTYRLQRVLMR